jgi:hypothetical protein
MQAKDPTARRPWKRPTNPRGSRGLSTRTHAQNRRRPRPTNVTLTGGLRGRRQPQGRLARMVKLATGRPSSRKQRGGSKKSRAALAVAAGAAGIAVVRRRRSAADNEPIGQVFAGADHETGAPTAAVAEAPAPEPATAREPEAEREPAKSGRRQSESKEAPE